MLTVKDTRILIVLAIPLVISGVIEASLGFTSTVFLAHISAQALAAAALVSWFFATMMVILWGLFTAVSVSVANRDGAKDQAGIANVIRDGFWISIALTIPITVLIWNMAPVLHLLGQSKALVQIAVPYLHALAWSILPDFTGLLLLQLVIGLGHMRTNLVFTISWVILNIAGNYVFIFGKLGLPAMGIAGLGWGTTFSFWITTLAWAIYLVARKRYRPYFSKLLDFSGKRYYWELTKVGIPTGAMWCIEVSFFFVLVLMIGHMGVSELAASQVAMQYVGLFVSVLFAIAQAITVRVSNRLGAKDTGSISNTTHSGLCISVSVMLVLALVGWLAPHYLIEIDFNPGAVKNAEVIHLARVFLAIGVTALLVESIRISIFGVMRGLKETHVSLLGSFLGFWVVAIPVGNAFAYWLHLGAIGLWLGFLVGVIFGAVFLFWRYQKTINRLHD